MNVFYSSELSDKYEHEPVLDTSKLDRKPLGKGRFFKADLDNNGRTDLIIYGTSLFGVTYQGNGTYHRHSIFPIHPVLDELELRRIDTISGSIALFIRSKPDVTVTEAHRWGMRFDTLVLKYGGFIEHNAAPDTLSIEEITLATYGCHGTCPVFTLTVKRTGLSELDARHYNGECNESNDFRGMQGCFHTVVDPKSFTTLESLINYIDVWSLPPEGFDSMESCVGGCRLEIRFRDGQVRKFYDVGMRGTYGLKTLYDRLSSLRDSLEWKTTTGTLLPRQDGSCQ